MGVEELKFPKTLLVWPVDTMHQSGNSQSEKPAVLMVAGRSTAHKLAGHSVAASPQTSEPTMSDTLVSVQQRGLRSSLDLCSFFFHLLY